ncbi:MAG: hypothetical protein IKS35_08595 [Clostridia bacterium]|nr:hypothetical protein [Clostridia bacterium]
MRKCLIVFLLLCLLLVSFAGCGTPETPAETSDGPDTGETRVPEPTETESESPPEEILGVPEDVNFDYEFRILTTESEDETSRNALEQFGNDQGIIGDVLSDAIYTRNKAVEERIGITFVLTATGWVTDTSAFETAVMSGGSDHSCDLGIYGDRFALNVALKGMVVPTVELEKEYLDLNRPWWYANMNETLTVASKQFFAAGYYDLSMCAGFHFVLVNRDMIEANNLEDPYDLVDSRNWTMGKMVELMTDAAEDLDGDEIMTENDFFGAAWINAIWYNDFISVSGEKIVKKDSNDLPVFNMPGNERLIDIMEICTQDLTDSYLTFNLNNAKIYKTGHVYEDVVGMFADGKALFAGTTGTYLGKLRNTQVNYGIVPFPTYEKIGSGEEYRSYTNGCLGYIVPTTCEDLSRTSAILETMSYYSSLDVIPAYIESVIQLKGVRDEKSREMLQMMNRNVDLDLAQTYWYDQITEPVVYAIFRDGINSYASHVEARRQAIEQILSNAVKEFEKIQA